MCVGTMALEAWLKLISYLSLYVDSSIETYCNSIPMPSQNEWSPKYYNIQVSWSSCGWFIGIIWWLANIQVKSLLLDDHELTKVYHLLIISFGCIWVDWIGYICNVACYEMIEWINCLAIKFGLIWVG
jgi:hypothetical protein